MTALLLGAIPASLSLVPAFLLTQAAFVQKSRGLHRAAVIFFALYLWAVFTVCGIPDVFTAAGDADICCIPFDELRENAAGILLNVVLFVPLGILLPLCWRDFRRFGRTLTFGFCLSLFVELSQLCNFRTTDITDLIANTAGAMLGYALVLPLQRRLGDLFADGGDAETGRAEAVFSGILVFLYTFFLAPVFGG